MLKTVSSVANALGALNYKGTWDASTNTPTLASGVGTQGDYYVVSVDGTTDLDGITNWGVGDWAAFNGSVWQRVEGGADGNFVNLDVTGTATIDGNLFVQNGDFTMTDTLPRLKMIDSDGTNQELYFEESGGIGSMTVRNGSNNGTLRLRANNGSTTTNTLEIDTSGNVKVLAGNLVIGTSGKGIDFSATAGTGTSELLDDYEEGTWTPAFAFDIGGTGIVYGTQSGKYTKIGNTVCVDFELNVASGISVADYFVRLSGIPFNCANDGLNIGRVWIQNPNSASFNLSVQGGSDSLICFTDNAASGAGSYARGDDVVGVTISGSFTYRTS